MSLKDQKLYKTRFKFTHIFIDKTAHQDEITQEIIKAFPDTKIQYINADPKFHRYLSNLSFGEGKRTLWLTHYKGNFLKPCPGTADLYRCCNYLVINETTNCPMDCSYCILQGYLTNPAVTIYTNYEKILNEVCELSKKNPDRILRIGTGELTDSLALDPITKLSSKLISTVQKKKNTIFELKTKTDSIDHLLNIDSTRIVLSWSVNPESLVRSDEYKTTPIHERLVAAQRAAKNGFMIGIHFDPIVHTQNWQNDYFNLIDQIAHHINPSRIAWISLGSLRYPAPLKEIYRSRFPKSQIFSGEQITGLDGKSRYIKPLRIDMYRKIFNKIIANLGDVFIYFCMEREDVWQKVLGKNPKSAMDIDWYFASSLYSKFPELKLPKPQKHIYQKQITFP